MGKRRPARVLDFGPVVKFVQLHLPDSIHHPDSVDPRRVRPSARVLAESLGVTIRTIQRIYEQGSKITVWEADRFACALGQHPFGLWGEAFYRAPADAGGTSNQMREARVATCAYSKCGVRFTTTHSSQKYHSKKCRRAASQEREDAK